MNDNEVTHLDFDGTPALKEVLDRALGILSYYLYRPEGEATWVHPYEMAAIRDAANGLSYLLSPPHRIVLDREPYERVSASDAPQP